MCVCVCRCEGGGGKVEGVRMTQGYMIHVFQTIYIDIPEKQNTQHNTKSKAVMFREILAASRGI